MKNKRKNQPSMYKTLVYLYLYVLVIGTPFIFIARFMRSSETFVLASEETTPYPEPEKEIVYERDVLEEIVEEAEEINSESKRMEEIIREVFGEGEHYEKAMLLLKGDGTGSCAENRSLNPEALNDNTTWGGTGKDWGLFQINDYWQGFRHEGKAMQYLLDPEINARVAWRLYEDDGYSFKLWTCGKHYGI